MNTLNSHLITPSLDCPKIDESPNNINSFISINESITIDTNNDTLESETNIPLNNHIPISNPNITKSNLNDKSLDSLDSAQGNIDISCFEKIKQLKQTNPNNLTCSYLNINSIRNKFHNLVDMLEQNIDIICLAETKLDSSFPNSNFLIPGYNSPYRLDVNSKSGGLLIYINETIPNKELTEFAIPNDLQIIPIEINLRKSKWLIIPIYKPPCTSGISGTYFIEYMNRIIDYYSQKYDNILTMGDFNMEITNKDMDHFMKSNNFHSLNKKPTCFKSKRGSCIDIFLTNKHRSFKYTNAFETGMSDHHLMIYTMFKTTFDKGKPIHIKYRSYKKFDSNIFTADLQANIYNIDNYDNLEKYITDILDRHAPIKNKVLRANNKPFMNKTLKKAISNRSRLRNIANKTGNEIDILRYKTQRNYVTSLNRKTQKNYFKKPKSK